MLVVTSSTPYGDLTGSMIVLDTNVLDQTSLLKDPLAVSLLAYLVRVDAGVALPEVVKSEWRSHWIEHCRKKYESHRTSASWLAGHFDGVPKFDLDIEKAAGDAFDLRLTTLGDLLFEEPVASDDWREAGEMVVRKQPPTTPGSQQYKDSLLWRALLRLGAGQPCILVSADKGFLKKGTTELEPSLLEEAAEHGADIRIATSLTALLEALKAQVGPIEEAIENEWDAILEAFQEDVAIALDLEGWILTGTPETSHSAFATDDPGIFAVAIEFESQLAPIDDPDADMSVYAMVKGSALFDLKSDLLDIDFEQVEIVVMTPHGDDSRTVVDRRLHAPNFTLRFS